MAFVETTLKDVGMVAYSPDDHHSESYLPRDKKWRLVWRDEFDGNALDESKWNYRLNFWGFRSPTLPPRASRWRTAS